MEEIYWLQRLGNINTLMWVVFGIALALVIISGCWWLASLGEGDEVEERVHKTCGNIFKNALIIVFISCLGGVFIPTTNEMYAIYGIGGTIDYLKENETAKQLPDKVVNALDKWIDGLNEDKEK